MAKENICAALKELIGSKPDIHISQLLLARQIGVFNETELVWDEVCAAALSEGLEVEFSGAHAVVIRRQATQGENPDRSRLTTVGGTYAKPGARAAEENPHEVAAKAREYVAAQKAEGKLVRISDAVAHVRKEMGLADTPMVAKSTIGEVHAKPARPQQEEAAVAGDLIREAEQLRTTLAKARPARHISVRESLRVVRDRISGRIDADSNTIAILAIEHQQQERERGRVISTSEAVMEICKRFSPGAVKGYEASIGGGQQ